MRMRRIGALAALVIALSGCEAERHEDYAEEAAEAVEDVDAHADEIEWYGGEEAEASVETSDIATDETPRADNVTTGAQGWVIDNVTTGSADFSSHAPASSDPVELCDRPRKMLRKSDCDRWKAYFASLETASVDVVAPSSMWQGEQETIEVSLLLDDAAIDESEAEGAEIVAEDVPVTPIMGARLRGDRFDIVPTTSSTITMDGADPEIVFIEVGIASRPTWKWNVVARGDGIEQLVVELFLVPDRDGDAPTDESYFKDAEAQITVNVRTIDRINQWIDDRIPVVENLTQFIVALTSLIGALFGLYWLIRRRGR